MEGVGNANVFPHLFQGYVDAKKILVKQVAAKRGLGDSHFSRKVNNPQEMSLWEAFLVGVATAEVTAEAHTKK